MGRAGGAALDDEVKPQSGQERLQLVELNGLLAVLDREHEPLRDVGELCQLFLAEAQLLTALPHGRAQAVPSLSSGPHERAVGVESSTRRAAEERDSARTY